MRQPILCPGGQREHGDAAAAPYVSSVRRSSVVRAFVGTNSSNAFDTVGETMLETKLAGGTMTVTSVASMAKASRSSIQGVLGRGEGFEIGTGAIRQF